VLQQRINTATLELGVAVAVDDHQHLVVFGGGFLGAENHLAGVGRGGDLIAHEPDDAGPFAAQATGEAVRCVVQVFRDAAHPHPGDIAELSAAAEGVRHGRHGDAGRGRHISNAHTFAHR